jgi:tetratricopeptide (TPR) repeat protein
MRNRLPGAICALALIPSSLLSGAQSTPNQEAGVQTLEQQVQSDLIHNQPKLAIPLLRKILSLEPGNLNAHANLGVLLFFQNDYQNAIPQMRAALQLKPDLARIRALLGIAEKRTGDPAAAQQDLEGAFPNLTDTKIQKEAGLELVELESASGQLAKALSVTEKLEELLPDDPQILFVSYEISEQVTYKSLFSMLVVAPDSAEMHMMMAGELARRGDHANAIIQYREAIRLNPNLPGAHFELAEQLRTSTDPALTAQAEDQFKAALQVNRYDEKAWRELGEIVAAKGDLQSAQEDYKKALALLPNDSDAETDLAISLISTNHASEALPLLQKAEKDDPTNMAAHYRLSLLYRRAGRTQDSEREMKLFYHYRDLKKKLQDIFKQMATQTAPG